VKQRIFLLVFVLFYLSCKKTVVLDDFDTAMAKVNFDCTGNPDSVFLQSKINGKDFCMSTDKEDGFISSSINRSSGNFSVQFSTGNNGGKVRPTFKMESPSAFARLSEVVLCDTLLKKGASYAIRSFNDPSGTKFNLSVKVEDWQIIQEPALSQTSSGDQDANANIVFDDVVKMEAVKTVTYKVKGHFNCKLYKDQGQTRGDLVWDMQNAQFKFSIVATK
jgi:hypothetical protein